MPAPRDAGSYDIATVATSGGPLLVPYEIRRSARSRRIRLGIGAHNQALLSVPARGSVREALHFLHTQGDWLERRLREAPAPVTLDAHLARHARLSGLGREFALTLNFTIGRPFYVVSQTSGEAEFRYPSGDSRERALKTLLRKFATEVFAPRT